MKFIPWDVPIKADWGRSNELVDLRQSNASLFIELIEEISRHHWLLTTDSWISVRVSTFLASSICFEITDIPGGFFEAQESKWLAELSEQNKGLNSGIRHFIICSYDECIEVACEKIDIKKLEDTGCA